MKYVLSMMLVLGAWSAPAQSPIDTEMMTQDLDLMETALGEMLDKVPRTQPSNSFSWSPSGFRQRVYGSYLEDYGVVFSVNSSGIPMVKVGETWNEGLSELFKDFLIDYADLIGQLNAGDKISVVTKTSMVTVAESSTPSSDEAVGYSSLSWENNNKATLRVTVTKKDLIDYYSGKMSREALRERIEVDRMDANTSDKPDLGVFAKLLHTRFKNNENLRTLQNPQYEYISGLGAVYHLEISYFGLTGAAATVERVFAEIAPSAAEDVRAEFSEERSEADQKVQERMEKFELQLKEFIIRYGRTLTSLTDEERLIIKVKTPRCFDCNLRSEIEYAVSKQVINQYAQGKISLDQAIGEISSR